jgi:uncharacterized membrane protein YhhN
MPGLTRFQWLGTLVVMAAALAIVSAPWALAQPWMNLVFKPLTTALIITMAWPRGRTTPGLRRWVLLGLGLSWLGDVALMWPGRGFLPGLISFLLAHLAYLMAFTQVQRLARRWLPFAAYAVLAAAVLATLWPGVPPALRGPVLAYVVCLATMAAQAAVVWRCQPADAATRRLALGGALFLTSDALLAINRFDQALPMASLWILGTYWAAQVCITSWLAPPDTAVRAGDSR